MRIVPAQNPRSPWRTLTLLFAALLGLGVLVPVTAERANAQSATLVVATYNVRAASSNAGTAQDLGVLLGKADALVLQEVGSAGKKTVVNQATAAAGFRVIYSPGPGDEAILWDPYQLSLQTKGAAVLNEPTAVGNPSGTIPRKYLTWGRFRFRSPSPEVGVVHLVARPHVDARRAALLQLEVRNLASTIKRLDFKKPLVGGDFNVDYNDPWLKPLRDIGLLNNHEFFAARGPLPTFYNASDGAPRTFDQWWFRPASQTGITPMAHEAIWRSSDHAAVVVTFTVNW